MTTYKHRLLLARHPVSWLELALIAGLLTLTVIELGYRFTLPTDGWLVSVDGRPGLTYTQNILGDATPLRAGDRVVAVAGIPVNSAAFYRSAFLRQAWRAGATLDYTVVREGQEVTVPVTLKQWRFALFVTNRLLDPARLILLLANLVLLAIATAIMLHRPDNQAAFPFLVVITILSVSGWSETLPFGLPGSIDPLASFFNQSNLYLTVVLFPTALVHFALVFPRPKPIQQRFPWLSAVLPAVTTVLLLFTWGSSIGWYWFLFSMFLGLAILVHSGITMRDPVSRAQIRWGVSGILLGIGALLAAVTVNTFGLVAVPQWWWDLIGTFATTVIGVTISIAITALRLFDIDMIIRRTLQYALLTALLAMVYFGSVIVLQTLLGRLVGEVRRCLSSSPPCSSPRCSRRCARRSRPLSIVASSGASMTPSRCWPILRAPRATRWSWSGCRKRCWGSSRAR